MANFPDLYSERVKAIESLMDKPPRIEVQTALVKWWDRPHSKPIYELDETDFAAFHMLVQENGYITPSEYEIVVREIVMPESYEAEAMYRLSTTMLREFLNTVVKKRYKIAKVVDLQANMTALPNLS